MSDGGDGREDEGTGGEGAKHFEGADDLGRQLGGDVGDEDEGVGHSEHVGDGAVEDASNEGQAEVNEITKSSESDRLDAEFLKVVLELELKHISEVKDLARDVAENRVGGSFHTWQDIYQSTNWFALLDKRSGETSDIIRARTESRYPSGRSYASERGYEPDDQFHPFNEKRSYISPDEIKELEVEHSEVSVDSPEFVELAFQAKANKTRKEFEERIERAEARAVRREEWAKAIHDNPGAVELIGSPGYEGSIEYTNPAELCVRMEAEAQVVRRRATILRDRAQAMSVPGVKYDQAVFENALYSAMNAEHDPEGEDNYGGYNGRHAEYRWVRQVEADYTQGRRPARETTKARIDTLLSDEEAKIGDVKACYTGHIVYEAEQYEKAAEDIERRLAEIKTPS